MWSLSLSFSIEILNVLVSSHFYATASHAIGSYSAVSSRTNTPNPFSGQQQQQQQQVQQKLTQQISRKEDFAGTLFWISFRFFFTWNKIYIRKYFKIFHMALNELASESVQRSTLASTTTESTKTPIVQTKIVDSSTQNHAVDAPSSSSKAPCDECGATIV